MTNERGAGDLPDWLPRARVVRGVMLVVALGLAALVAQARWPGGAVVPVAVAAIAGAIWLDGEWLKRNHHRVNTWGISRGKAARTKPK